MRGSSEPSFHNMWYTFIICKYKEDSSRSSRSILGIETFNVCVYVYRQLLQTYLCVFTQAVATLGPHRGRSDSESSAFLFRPDRSRPILNCWDVSSQSHVRKGKTSQGPTTHGNIYMAHMVAFRSAIIKTHTAGLFSESSQNPGTSQPTATLPVGELPLLPAGMPLKDERDPHSYVG